MKSFAEQLPNIAGGGLNEELTQALADVFEYLDVKSGTPVITLQMKFTKQDTKMGVTVKVNFKVDTKFPKEKPLDFTMFLTKDGNLELNNPSQDYLPFKEVTVEPHKPEIIPQFGKKPTVYVNPETGEILS